MTQFFNLVDEPWIPVADYGRASLKQIFQNPEYQSLGGNPVQKIALMKLLLAIAQAAATPVSEKEHETSSFDGLAKSCIDYLEHWHDRFYLYGPEPFLQMPASAQAKVQPYGAVIPEVATGNTTLLTQIQASDLMNDADRAILLITLMSFALSGKKTDNAIVLSPGYTGKQNDKGKPSSGKFGPAVGYFGFLHNFYFGETLQQGIWVNLLTSEQVKKTKMFPEGVGVPPWEKMPQGEDDNTARALRRSLMGRLVPLSRFCLLKEVGLHYTEGIAHDGFKEGVADPSIAINYSGTEPKALWVNPEKRPWRELTSLLSFLGKKDRNGFQSLQLQSGISRVRRHMSRFAVWSGGLRVSSNAGEQYASGTDDFVSSLIWFESAMLGETWFTQLENEMGALETLSKKLYGTVSGYYKELSSDGTKIAAQASYLFWQRCESEFQNLIDHCPQGEENQKERQNIRRRFAAHTLQTYDQFCPKESARQLDAWVKCQPSLYKYLNQED